MTLAQVYRVYFNWITDLCQPMLHILQRGYCTVQIPNKTERFNPIENECISEPFSKIHYLAIGLSQGKMLCPILTGVLQSSAKRLLSSVTVMHNTVVSQVGRYATCTDIIQIHVTNVSFQTLHHHSQAQFCNLCMVCLTIDRILVWALSTHQELV